MLCKSPYSTIKSPYLSISSEIAFLASSSSRRISRAISLALSFSTHPEKFSGNASSITVTFPDMEINLYRFLVLSL